MYLPDGLLTSGFLKHDVEHNPHIIAPDPFASDDCLDVFSPVYQFLPLEPEELNTMNPSEDEPSSGLNGRLRPRKSAIPSPLSIKQIVNKLDGKQAQEKLKRSNTPSKASQSKPEDLSNTSNLLPTLQLLCPYCDRKFGSKQTVSKHIRRLHLSASSNESSIICLFCNHVETEASNIIRHMIDSHPNQYFACLDCHTRFPSTKELAEHKLNICEKQKISFRSKLRRKTTKKNQKVLDTHDKDDYSSKNFSGHSFNGIVISCELKPAHIHDEADIEDNITTNLILPPSKNLSTSAVLDKNAVIVLDDIQWNRRIPSNFSFHNTDTDQILSRLGVVHRSPKTGESTKKDWFRAIEDATQKFEKCFDTSFYSKVASNVQENLTKFLDGSFNFNPDPDSTIKTRKSKNSVVINTAEGFPILLAYEQYSRNTYDGYIPRTIAPKHKWKWDNLESEKPWNPDQIKRDTHANNCIITLVSSLDIWTQLRMRRKFEDKFNITPVEKKTEKQKVISKELKEILESREIPASNSQITKQVIISLPAANEQNFPSSLGLIPSSPKFNVKPAILSGEWVRPRCYVCCACGAQSRDSRTLSMHVSSKHPNAQVQHYEIVGESLLKADILKHLYVPPNQNINRTRPPRGFRDCTKCLKSIAIEDLHQHMLDCAGDTPAVRRKCRYRPFGVRRRRPRLPDNRIRKKMRNDIRSRPSRQKNRMRTKPKIRSEVGDAETIRKMLADLPAKRHRVLVNPLNSILRPRRKLDKQRAMLMMKRRTSDDPKSIKSKTSNNNKHYDHQQTSTNSDKYKSIPNRDDDDNEPLKSRLKRVACKLTRQKESLTRKTMLKKPKRKVRAVHEKKENEGPEKQCDMSCSVKVQSDELSVNHNDKRINLNVDPQNIREHSSGRGDTNNGRRDNQRPGCSGQNGNSRNVCAPAQNVPLKHSIARLTANSETHDKSVQFHHLFLVQQECNNTNEHVPTGQRVLFENEAVVTKLDKPPLHFTQNSSTEPVQEHDADPIQDNNVESIQEQTLDSIQKNKLNKPRKGLNDCIAMLKNKLVDTDSNAPAHVSVQCGTEDLLSPDPVHISTPTLISPRVDVLVKPVQACPNVGRPKKSSSKSIVRNDQLPKTSSFYPEQYLNHDMYGHANIDRQSTTQWRPVNYDAIMPRFIDNRPRKETIRRRSTSQHENLFFTQQLLNVTPPNDDMLIKLSSESYNAYNLTSRKSSKNCSEQFNVHGNKISSKLVKRKSNDQNPVEASNGSLQNCGIIVNNHTERNKKTLDTSKKSAKSRLTTPKKPVEILDKHVNIRKDVPKNTKDSIEKYRKKSLDCQPQRDFTIKNVGERKSESYSYDMRKKRNSNVNTEVNLSSFKQAEVQSKTDMNVKMPINVYTDHNLNDNQVSIPLAHASTNVESILLMPLDLSSKAQSVDPKYSSRHDSILLNNYDKNETLDLSNKRRSSVEPLSECEIVDLRVKHSTQYPHLPALIPSRSSSSQQELSTAIPLNLVHSTEYVPTDLSIKRKEDINICINLSQKINPEETEIQDLSKSKQKAISNEDILLLNNELPTDLSNKKDINIENTVLTVKESNLRESIVKESNKNNSNEILTIRNDHNGQNELNDLSEKEKSEKLDNCNAKVVTSDNHVALEQTNTTLHENINNVDETHITPEMNTLSQISKPVYDPTLRIPKYKIRPTGNDPTSRETNVTLAPSIVAVSTCVESYSSHSNAVTSSHSTYRLHNSTINTNSMIASIEAQERITYSFTKSILNTAVTSAAGPLPVYSLLNRGVTTPFTTFESTRPVYALSNACISMAKVDVTTNSLLSIPSTTIMSTTPVYTLAGTTVVTPLNYVALPNTSHSIPYPPTCNPCLPEIDSQIMTHYASSSSSNTTQEGKSLEDNILIRGAMFNIERDHEITKKLVMLPKDIMAILKTMPVEHRNQLLEVLSQYLSVSRPIPIFSSQTSLFKHTGPSLLTLPIRLSRELAVDASTDTVDIKPLYSLQNIENRGLPQYKPNSGGTSSYLSDQHPDKINLNNQVIDLTYDEIVPKTDTDNEANDDQQMLSTDEISTSIASISNVLKTNNDKTASLRAVRIKAPSERQKSKIVSNPLENLPCPEVLDIPRIDDDDNETFQSLDTDASSDIQMYEVSSTNSNKNKVSYELSRVEISRNKESDQPVCNKIIIEKHGKELQPEMSKNNLIATILSGNSAICNETKDPLTVTKNIDSNMNDNFGNATVPILNEKDISSVSVSAPNVHEKPMVADKLSLLDNEDDSDDDISLAVIVKQKQQAQNKLKEVPPYGNETEKNISNINTIEKDKTINILHDQQVKQTDPIIPFEAMTDGSTIENFVNETEVGSIVTDDTGEGNRNITVPVTGTSKLIAEDGIEMTYKQCKKKGKKNRRSNLSVKEVKTQDNKVIKKMEYETDKNKKNDNQFESLKNSKDVLSLNAKERDVSVESYTDLSYKKVNVQENAEILNTSTVDINSVSYLHDEPTDIDGCNTKVNVLDVQGKEENKNVRNMAQSVELLLEACHQEEGINRINEPSTVFADQTPKENCIVQTERTGRFIEYDGNTSINIMSHASDVNKTLDEEDIGLPLRRSRRGKSLFVESNEEALIYSDTFLEQKAPLTKKQLIFSKLLLDEENNLKNSAPVEDSQTSSAELFSLENNSKSNACPLATSESMVLEEKNKTVKRKKSPILKKKAKKKKSTDNSQFVNSDDDLAKSFIKENSNPKIDCDTKLSSLESCKGSNLDIHCGIELASDVTQSQDKFNTDNNNELLPSEFEVNTEQNTSVKRKIVPSINNHLEHNVHSSKPKKLKLNNVNDVLVSLHSDTTALDKNYRNANYNKPLPARRARSKSVVVKSSGSMLYDPYDIDLEDMGDKTEPFRKQKLTLLRNDDFKSSKENYLQMYTSTSTENATNIELNLSANTTEAITVKDSREAISDSDESSKSDVPLKKYVEDKERKNSLCDSSNIQVTYNIGDEGVFNDNDIKQSRKKHKKNKRSIATTDIVQKEDKDEKEISEEQLRSEQFMESFGFFSERKPRKSNLLATKKISETFHIIANESEDVYLDTKERSSKKNSRNENKRTPEEESTKYSKPSNNSKVSTKPDKNLRLRSATLYCHICKKEFRRTDNLVRHQLTLFHASKLSESAMKVRTMPVPDDLNYLVVFKQQIDRLRILEHKMKSKKHCKTKFTLPTLQQILVDVRKTVSEEQLARRNLSRDQALFLDCCELLKDSNRGQIGNRNITRPLFPCCPNSYTLACTNAKEYDPQSGLSLEFNRYVHCPPSASDLSKKPIIHTSARLSGMADFVPLSSTSKQAKSADCYVQPSTSTSVVPQSTDNFIQACKPGIIEEIVNEKDDSKSDGDVDSITAQNILESEEVRNLEKDLISGLKEAACKFQPLIGGDKVSPTLVHDNLTNKSYTDSVCPEVVINASEKKEASKTRNNLDTKETKKLDIIEKIDIFEDKFDKIKRKCRSQAAAAKLIQTAVEPSASHKSRKKSDKKKGKKNSKKYNQNTVLTKGALKGYDSIKVSILTSDIDMSAIVPSIASKKKKKRSSKKKRDRKNSALTRKLDTNGATESSHKNIDVYEFLDNEEPEIFELRPSTVMERFRNLNKKDTHSSAKIIPTREENESSDSVSDGDDFVYMSDDYVCSEDETESSLISCEMSNVKGSNEIKKSGSPLKRKDVMEKNAVMGKIFKHNAVRSEKRSIKPKESTNPKANLDQLFDSLLEEEPNSSLLMNDAESPKRDNGIAEKKRVFSPIVLSKYDLKTTKHIELSSRKIRSPSPALSSDSAVSRRISSFSSQQSSPRLSSSRYDIPSPFEYEPSTSKRYDVAKNYDRISKNYDPTKKYDLISENKYDMSVPNNIKINDDLVLSPKSDNFLYDNYDKATNDRTLTRKKEKVVDYRTSYDFEDEDERYFEAAKMLLSDDAGVARQRARRKCTVGKQNILAETWSSESELEGVPPRPNSAESVVLGVARKRKGRKREGHISGGRKGNKHLSVKKQDLESRVTSSNRNTGTSSGVAGIRRSSGGSSAYTQHLSLPGPSGIGPRLRPTTSFWTNGDEEPEHVQQHGWIVGDSHKKLVTMLAHAKGRKRNNDDKLRLLE